MGFEARKIRANFGRFCGPQFPRFLDRLRRARRKIQLHFGTSFAAKRAKFEAVSPRIAGPLRVCWTSIAHQLAWQVYCFVKAKNPCAIGSASVEERSVFIGRALAKPVAPNS